MTHKTLSFRVTGRVQGVWYRAWTKREAERLGLSGWVRNEADGSVRGLVSGEAGAMAEMVAALHEGPEAARVERVETGPAEAPATAGFAIRR